MMDENAVAAGWARRVAAEHAWLLHTPTMVVGRAEEALEGSARGIDGRAVDGVVVRLDAGHTLLANPCAFVELTELDVMFYAATQRELTDLLRNLAAVAVRRGMPAERGIPLLRAALQAQVAQLAAMVGAVASEEACP